MANWKKQLEKLNKSLSVFGICFDVEYSHSDRQYSIYQTKPNCIICKQAGLLKDEICEFLDVIAYETVEEAIKTPGDVSTFYGWILDYKGVFMHPDDSYYDCINFETKERTFTDAEAKTLDNIVEKCFDVCEGKGVDVYEFAGIGVLPF